MGSPTRSETQSVCSSSHSSPLQNEVLIPQVLQVNSRNKEKMSDSSSLTTAIQTEKQNPEAGESRQVFCEPGNCPCQPAPAPHTGTGHQGAATSFSGTQVTVSCRVLKFKYIFVAACDQRQQWIRPNYQGGRLKFTVVNFLHSR